MKRSKKRNHAIIVLIVLLIAIAVGYAAYSTVLKINGTATASATWDVKFTDAKLLDSTGAVDSNHGSVTFTDTAVNATGITLAYPGDAVNLRTVITNGGTLDAKLTTLNVDKSQLGSEITVTEATHTQGDVLAHGQSCTSDFVVQWKPNSTAASATGSFTVTFTYDQDAQAITITPAHSDAATPAATPNPEP